MKNPQKRIRKNDEQLKRIKGKGYEKTVQKEMQMANKHMKRYPISLLIKKMQI